MPSVFKDTWRKPQKSNIMNNLTELQGQEYQLTNQLSRARINGYHGSPSAIFLDKAKKEDLKGLGRSEQFFTEAESGDIEAKYTIGFEIEKTRFHRNSVTEYVLFKGFERDGSCGVEAVTNPLPLVPKSQWRLKVYNMFAEARKIIDDQFSPSDTSCGGHIHLGVKDMSGMRLQELLRPYVGIVYAIFRKRLKNSYCRFDIFCNAGNPQGIRVNNPHKYRVMKVMGSTIEFRVPSRVQNVAQLMRRYELCYELLNAAINQLPYREFEKKIKPIVMAMYDRDADKVKKIFKLAKSFNKMIATEVVTEDCAVWIEGLWSPYNNARHFANKYNRSFASKYRRAVNNGVYEDLRRELVAKHSF